MLVTTYSLPLFSIESKKKKIRLLKDVFSFIELYLHNTYSFVFRRIDEN